MASSEGFLTEEQREMLKVASQNVENLSSSPKSPTSLLAEHHIKAPVGGKAQTAGIAVRHVRRSHSGKFVRVKKGSDSTGIDSLKKFLGSKFQTKDMGDLKYFLGIEVNRSKRGIFLSQRKYVLDLLTDTNFLGSKPSDAPMIPNVKLNNDDEELLESLEMYRKIVGKLNYLTVKTRYCIYNECSQSVHIST